MHFLKMLTPLIRFYRVALAFPRSYSKVAFPRCTSGAAIAGVPAVALPRGEDSQEHEE